MEGALGDRISEYEDLISSMQDELNFYKQEHVGLRNDVFKVLDDNKRLSEAAKRAQFPTDQFRQANSWAPPDKNLDEVATNLQAQIRELVEENRNLDNIWKLSKDTITELEREIIQYRDLLNAPNSVLKLKEDYERKIRELETKLEVIMNESKRVKNYNTEILNQKLSNDEKINELLRRLEELNSHEQRLSEKQIEIEEIQNDNRRLVGELDRMKRRVNDALRREKDALHKMQEALVLAEAAAEKKEQADQQFTEIKEEYDKLVQVLGEVMRDAGQQVEEKVQKMKARYKDQIKRIQTVLDKSLEELKMERETRLCISTQAEELQMKLMDALKGSQLLDQDLYEATQNIVDMELKINAYEKIINSSEMVKTMNEQRIGDLETFLQQNKLLKRKWCKALDEITARFQTEFDELMMVDRNNKCQSGEVKGKEVT